MKKIYQETKVEFVALYEEDVLTTSAEFQDATTGDNGVWFPGQNPNGGEGTWQ